MKMVLEQTIRVGIHDWLDKARVLLEEIVVIARFAENIFAAVGAIVDVIGQAGLETRQVGHAGMIPQTGWGIKWWSWIET